MVVQNGIMNAAYRKAVAGLLSDTLAAWQGKERRGGISLNGAGPVSASARHGPARPRSPNDRTAAVTSSLLVINPSPCRISRKRSSWSDWPQEFTAL
ncbi:hypothetical protein J6590_019749 [Homalodisca vitripennis]|nr:hypothetical protein J6590_019749 [Homalodisca vitripennis]